MIERRFTLFALSVFVLHQLPTVVGEAGEWVDLLTPFGVLGAAAWLLAGLRPRPAVLIVAAAAAVLYVDGHGIHLAANAIAAEAPGDTAHFWDEVWGHLEWHTGWFLLLAALAAAEPARLGRPALLGSALLGWTLFTNTVEGGTWWLALPVGAAFAAWALRERRPLALSVGAAFALCALLTGVWALWQGGVPQFSEAGLL